MSNQNITYQQCSRCILDTNDDPQITFDSFGVCSYCRQYDEQEKRFVKKDSEGEQQLKNIISQIKEAGAGKPYDCILGISGGIDSTYLALKAKEFGLRPLAIHFDNGWNSELAVSNIESIISKLRLDLKTFVIDWDEFKDLQLAFLRASVVDIELITDHAILAKLYQLAIDHNIKYILSGGNIVTEFILPKNWIHDKRDHVNIRSIHKLFGKRSLSTFPLYTSFLKWRVVWKGVKSVTLLDLLPYNKEEVKHTISKELGWRDYGGKHYESVFTRFYQGYILPVKFGIDKRKAHLSNLICSGQLTRVQALEELRKTGYEESMINADYEFVIKKLSLTKEEFEVIMKLPVKNHTDYETEKSIYARFPILKLIRPFWIKFKSLKKMA